MRLATIPIMVRVNSLSQARSKTNPARVRSPSLPNRPQQQKSPIIMRNFLLAASDGMTRCRTRDLLFIALPNSDQLSTILTRVISREQYERSCDTAC